MRQIRFPWRDVALGRLVLGSKPTRNIECTRRVGRRSLSLSLWVSPDSGSVWSDRERVLHMRFQRPKLSSTQRRAQE
jgi:hypothetical protein